MKNLTIHRLAFSVLMMCVLAFGVQGVVEAQSVSVSGDGSTSSASSGYTVITDYRTTPATQRSFRITVSGAEDGETITITGLEGLTGTTTATDVSITEVTGANSLINDDGSVGSLPASSVIITADAPNIGAGRDMNGDGDELDIVTSFSEATLGVDLNGDGDQTDTVGSIQESALSADLNGDGDQTDTLSTVYEYTEDPNWRGSATLTVEYTVNAFGVYRIVVTANDIDTDISGSPITGYIVRSDSLSTGVSIAAGATTTETPQLRTGNVQVTISPATSWTRVDLSVSGGRLYLDSGQYLSGSKLQTVTQRKESTTLSMFTDDSGTVTANLIQNSGQAAKITAKIPGSNQPGKTYVVTSFASAIVAEQISGNHQLGPTTDGYIATDSLRKNRERLSNPLEVRVTDGYGTNKGIGGQWVEFAITGAAVSDGQPFLRAFSRGLLWDGGNNAGTADGNINDADDNLPTLAVQTDGSGYAKVYFVPGNAADTYTITSRLVNQTSPTIYGTAGPSTDSFTATVIRSRSDVSSFTIDKTPTSSTTTTPQIYDRHEPMSVLVTDGEADVKINFSVTGGQITRSRSAPNYQTSLSTVTNDDGVATVYVYSSRGNSLIEVRAWIAGREGAEEATHVVTYFSNYVHLERVSVNHQSGVKGTQLQNPLVVQVKDGPNGSPVPGQIVKFTVVADSDDGTDPDGGATPSTADPVTRRFVPVPGTTVYVTDRNGGTLSPGTDLTPGSLITYSATSQRPAPGTPIFVQTDSNGEAKVYLLLGTGSTTAHSVTADMTLFASDVLFGATALDASAAARIEIVSGDSQRAGANQNLEDALVVIVRDLSGGIVRDHQVRFTTDSGALSFPKSTDPGENAATILSGGTYRGIRVNTDRTGRASIRYNVGDDAGAKKVHASITAYDGESRRVTFNINGGGSTNTPTTRTPYLSISPSSLTGSPGQQRSFTVSAFDRNNRQTNTVVNLSSSGVSVPATVNSGQSVSITLPSSSASISASASGYTSRTLTVNVQAIPDEIVKVSGDSPVQTGEPGAQLSSAFVVRVEDSSNNPIPQQTVTFQVTGGGGSLSSTSVTTDSSGEARATLTLGSSAGTNTVEASVSGVPAVTFTATTGSQATDLTIYNGNNQVGEVNRRLGQPLTVQVVDSNNNGIEGILVTFRVTEGSGLLSPPRSRTDRDGFASATFTPRSAGRIQVDASAAAFSPVTFTITMGEPPDALVYISGNNQSGRPGQALANPFVVEVVDENDDPVDGAAVTFAVTAGGGSVSTTSTTTNNNGRAQTVLTLGDELGDNTVVARVAGLTDRITFTARTGAEVLVSAAQRPPLYWVDRTNGTLHRLVDEETEDLASNMKGATNITVDAANGYIYWTAQTAQNKGAIRRAGLNGRGAQTLKAVSSLPMGIAVDSAGGIVYWTNARGNILSMPVAGGKVTNIAKNLSNPGPLALSNGVLYWGEETGSVRKLSLTAKPKKIDNLATGLGAPIAIAIAKGKVYWIERGAGGGRLQRANLNGTGIQTLKAFPGGVPIGFTIDSSANRIYWTKSAGKIQRSNLAGKFVKDIVTGLPNPGSIAIGTGVADDAPVVRQPAQPTQPTQPARETPPATADTSQYDVNGDGAVNEEDVNQVVQAVAFKSGDMKYDLNGDGVVDAKDITVIVGATSSAGAAAPSLLTGIDVTLLDVTVLHEQIAVLLASGDRSLAAKQTLAYLQELLTLARPDETVLLANYPNPFNPETWIPYHLSESTDVQVNIYDAQGTLVRELILGHQTAGYYTSRSRAAYWDGRNAIGERVASGIYFYQLQTDTVSPMRKMVILK